jgi:hypothetical protein
VHAQASLFYPIYGKLVNSNWFLIIFYGVDLTMGKIGYIHEVSARLLFIYEGLVDFAVIWF